MLEFLKKLINKIEKTFFLIAVSVYFFVNFKFNFFKFFKKVYLLSLREEWSNLQELFKESNDLNYFNNKSFIDFDDIDFLKLDQYSLFICYIFSRLNKSFEKQYEIKKILKKKLFFFPKMKRILELPNFTKKKFYLYNPGFLQNDNEDFLFSNLIQGKSVAVVGPANTNIEKGQEIDNYDIVVRTNFSHQSNLPHAVYGKKTSVAYYNSYRVQKNKNSIINVSEKLDFLILKSKNDLSKISNNKIKDKIRVCNKPNSFFFLSSPMSPQLIVYDLIKFKPSKIKLFHFDFYYKYNYSKFYKNFGNSHNHIANSLRAHGGVDCFLFLKKLYDFKYFSIDKETCPLDLSVEKYISGLDIIYGNTRYTDGH